MSKKRRYQPDAGSQSKNFARNVEVAPERVLLVGGRHVVRDDVQHDAETGLAGSAAERAELSLAAEVVEMRVGSTTS